MNDNQAAVPCPKCGNDDVDTLIWDDANDVSGFVTCWLCGTRYNPLTGEMHQPS